MPSMSQTEQEALAAGTVGFEAELFRGEPDWQALLATPAPKLSEEVLATTMIHHQRFFPTRDKTGKLAPHFVGISNNKVPDEAVVRQPHDRQTPVEPARDAGFRLVGGRSAHLALQT